MIHKYSVARFSVFEVIGIIKFVVSSVDTFSTRFPNIFADYPFGEVRIGNKS